MTGSGQKIPAEISQVTAALQEAGYEAYLVGGCVRDILRGVKPKDWDVTTNARPENIAGLFEHTFYENDFGTVSVVNDDTKDESLKVIEVTPYRLEAGYSDNRRPDTVEFSESLEDDLKRRDFTINAIAYDPQKDIFVDPYKGQNDIKDKIIRAVGEPRDRFSEDVLRILRAIRLQAELDFTLEDPTKRAMTEFVDNLQSIAKERIRDEFSRIMASSNPETALSVSRETGILKVVLPELTQAYDIKQNQAHSYTVWTHLLKSAQHAADKNYPLKVRLAALFHDVGKPATRRWEKKKQDWSFHGHEVVGARMTEQALKRLCYPRDLISQVVILIRWHMFFSDPEEISLSAVRRMVRNVGPDNVKDLMNLRICDRIGTGRPKERPYRLRKYESMIEEVLRDPISVKQLAVNGDTILRETDLEPGPKIGYILHALLEEVLDEPTRNSKDHLMKRVHTLSELPEDELKRLGEGGRQKLEEEEKRHLDKIRSRYGVR